MAGLRGAVGPRPGPADPLCTAGTRFRPLSFEVPKPLFPVAGVPMVQHHIEACAKVRGGRAEPGRAGRRAGAALPLCPRRCPA